MQCILEDDMVLHAEDEECKGLKILGNWVVEWLVKVNVYIAIGNCALVHSRKRIVERCEVEFRVNKYA